MLKGFTGDSRRITGIDDPRFSGNMPRAINDIGEEVNDIARHLSENQGSPPVDDTHNRTFWCEITRKFNADATKGYEYRLLSFSSSGTFSYQESSDRVYNYLFDINGNKGLMRGHRCLAIRTDDGTIKSKCYIIPAIPHALFPVNVTQSGGSDGNSTDAATWTYTVKTVDNAYTLSTSAMTPAWARFSKGPMAKATHGTAYYTAAGVLVLYQVDEQEDSTTCVVSG